FGIQTWVALPEAAEDTDPAFEHASRKKLPFMEGEGKQVRLILGTLYGETAPVKTFSDMFYADAVLFEGAKLPLTTEHEDRGLYIANGEIEIAGDRFAEGQMMVFRPGDEITITATRDARLILLGGATLEGPRHIWWNFVATSKERIDAAKAAWAAGDWEHGRFQLPPDDKDEFIPLPER
ncbi:MAG: pirin-like C-terminal cupin domain-containing protein, partial [Pseudomonadota bacterium]